VPNTYLTAPVAQTEAEAWLATKTLVPTALRSAEIARAWDAETKRAAFFSARVTSATALSELKKKTEQVLAGDMTDGQAAELLRMWMTGNGAGALQSMGFKPPDMAGPVSELASSRRLQLILYQNTKMAQEVGGYRDWMENKDIVPYGRWHVGVSRVHRPEHLARDGNVYRWDDPVWTVDPPGGAFNCACWREEITAEEAGFEVSQSTSGIRPSPLEFDPSAGLAPEPVIPESMDPDIAAALEEILA
jgi:hypothetical protein